MRGMHAQARARVGRLHGRLRRSELCKTLAGNTCDVITITADDNDEVLLKTETNTAKVTPAMTSRPAT